MNEDHSMHDDDLRAAPSAETQLIDGDADAHPSDTDNRPVTYEAALACEPHLAGALEAYMRVRHVPQIFATGCFRSIRFERAGPTRFRTLYTAATRADLDRYLAEHTAAMRADFVAHFPTGVTVTRAEWDMLEAWGES